MHILVTEVGGTSNEQTHNDIIWYLYSERPNSFI